MNNICAEMDISTFSILGYDSVAEEWGVAVQSKNLGVGARVPWVEAGVGAIATQARANVDYGRRGLDLLRQRLTPAQVVKTLTDEDEMRELRQLAVMDVRGNVTAYIGSQCSQWAGHVIGRNHSCQGNILASERVVSAMSESFTHTTGRLAERLVAALAAGQSAGGDSRGRQAAALLVGKRQGARVNHRYIDIRVDDHMFPIDELSRLLELYAFMFLEDKPASIPYGGTMLYDLQGLLGRVGLYQGAIDGTTDVRMELAEFARNEGLQAELLEGRVSTRLIQQLRQKLSHI